jgi:hypothetical protein
MKYLLKIILVLSSLFTFPQEIQAQGFWALFPGYAKVKNPNGSFSGLGSGIGIESQIYTPRSVFGASCHLATTKYLNFDEGMFFKFMLRYGRGFFTETDEDKSAARGLAMGLTAGLYTCDNGKIDGILPPTGLGVGVYGQFALNKNLWGSMTYEALKDYFVQTYSLQFFGFVSLNYAHMKGPEIKADYLYMGFVLTLKNHNSFENFFQPQNSYLRN